MPGQPVTQADRFSMDDSPIWLKGRLDVERRVLVYHKPEGEVVTRRDPERRPTVFKRLPKLKAGRWIAIGRLDVNTAGLLMLTTDGELARRMMHPGFEIQRVYLVRVLGRVTDNMLEALTKGVKLDDGMARFESIEDVGGRGANHWYRVTLSEGRNRIVRRLWESQGLQVSRLKRAAYGPVELPSTLRPGKSLELEKDMIDNLLKATGMEQES